MARNSALRSLVGVLFAVGLTIAPLGGLGATNAEVPGRVWPQTQMRTEVFIDAQLFLQAGTSDEESTRQASVTSGDSDHAPAAFDNMYPTQNLSRSCQFDVAPCRTETRLYDFYLHSSLPSTFKGGARSAMDNMDNTDMITYELTYAQMDPDEVDGYIIVTQLGNTLAGRASCARADPNRPSVCRSYRLYIDDVASTSDWAYAKALTCHESGHSIGLTHGDSAYPAVSRTHPDLACMRTPATREERYIDRGTQDDQINATY